MNEHPGPAAKPSSPASTVPPRPVGRNVRPEGLIAFLVTLLALATAGCHRPGSHSWKRSDTHTTLAAGGMHFLALQSDGSLWAWGGNDKGQLGIGSAGGPMTLLAQPVAPGTTWSGIAACDNASLGLQTGGGLWGWGNLWRELDPATTPQPIDTNRFWIRGVVSFAWVAALDQEGALWGWKRSHEPNSPALPLRLGSGFQGVAAAGNTVIGLKQDGSLQTWRDGDYDFRAMVLAGQTNTAGVTPIPRRLVEGTRWTRLHSNGTGLFAAEDSAGALQLWKDSFTNQVEPVGTLGKPPAGWRGVLFTEGARKYGLAGLDTDGSVWAAGQDTARLAAALGARSPTPSKDPVPTDVIAFSPGWSLPELASDGPVRRLKCDWRWTDFVVGWSAGAAIREDGSLWTWGLDGTPGARLVRTGPVWAALRRSKHLILLSLFGSYTLWSLVIPLWLGWTPDPDQGTKWEVQRRISPGRFWIGVLGPHGPIQNTLTLGVMTLAMGTALLIREIVPLGGTFAPNRNPEDWSWIRVLLAVVGAGFLLVVVRRVLWNEWRTAWLVLRSGSLVQSVSFRNDAPRNFWRTWGANAAWLAFLAVGLALSWLDH